MQSQRGVSRPANTFTQRLATAPSGQGPSVGTWGYTDAGDVWVAAVDPGATGQSLWIQMASSASIAIPSPRVPYGTGTGLTSNASFFYTAAGGILSTGRLNVNTLDDGSASPSLEVLTASNTAPLTASVEMTPVFFSLDATMTFATGPLATQRAFVISPPTLAFAAGSVVTTAATLAIAGATLQGANATVTSSRALWIQEGSDSAGVKTSLWVDGQVNVAQVIPAGTEQPDFVVNSTRSVNWATGALALQRFNIMSAPTLRFAGASTVTETSTLDVDGPQAGTNATLIDAYAIKASIGTTNAAAAASPVVPVAAFLRYVTDTPGSHGIGASIRLQSENDASSVRTAVELQGVLDSAGDTAENSSLRVLILGDGATQGEAFRVAAPGGGPVVNRVTVYGATVAVPQVNVAAEGTSADIDLLLTPKGTGTVIVVGSATFSGGITASLLTINETAQSDITITAASSNTVLSGLRLSRTNSGGAGANEIGSALELAAETATEGTNAVAAKLDGVLTDATLVSLRSRFAVNILGNAVQSEAFRVSGPAATIVNRVEAVAAATGVAVQLIAEGETNVGLNLRAKGATAVSAVRVRNPDDSLTIFGVAPNAAFSNFGVTYDWEDQTGANAGAGGNATCNHAAGAAAIAAGAAACTITNNLVTANSIVTPVLQFVDATLTQILTCVPGAGSFVVTGNAAATAKTRFSFTVVNPAS